MEYRYWFGKKFVKGEDGTWKPCGGTPLRNRYGVPTTLVRVPTAMVAVLQLFLDKWAEVETVRRNMSMSVRNSTPDFVPDLTTFFSDFNKGAKDE